MSDKLNPTSPITPAATAQPGSHQTGWTDPRLAAKSKLASATSVEIDPSLDLDAASAQLSALRNQANAAAASGNFSALQQLALHAVALGVAAGQHAETLANGIAAKVAANGSIAADKATGDSGQSPDASLTALGLKPEEIARVFAGAAGDAPSTTSAGSGIAAGLHELAALNARANGVITDARSLLAAMNQAVGTATSTDRNEVAPATGDQSLTLNGLSQLLDQAESALSAKVYAIGQQLTGAGPSTGDNRPAMQDTGAKTSSLDLKT